MNGNSTQGSFDFSAPVRVSLSKIDTRSWKRLSVATGRCLGRCSSCTCVSDLQILAHDATIQTVAFSGSGSPILSREQLRSLRSRKETSIFNESTDVVDICVTIPPAPLAICSDDEL